MVVKVTNCDKLGINDISAGPTVTYINDFLFKFFMCYKKQTFQKKPGGGSGSRGQGGDRVKVGDRK